MPSTGGRRERLHRRDARDDLDLHVGEPAQHRAGEVAERRVDAGIADRREADRLGARLERLDRGRRRRLPRLRPARGHARAVGHGERHAPDLLGRRRGGRHDDRLGAARVVAGRLRRRDEHDIAGLQRADGLERDVFGVSGADTDPNETAWWVCGVHERPPQVSRPTVVPRRRGVPGSPGIVPRITVAGPPRICTGFLANVGGQSRTPRRFRAACPRRPSARAVPRGRFYLTFSTLQCGERHTGAWARCTRGAVGRLALRGGSRRAAPVRDVRSICRHSMTVWWRIRAHGHRSW